jgi:hypothetical protein
MSEWISVEDRSPEHDVPVLTWDGSNYGIDWLDYYTFGGPEWNGDSHLIPTHWMPLPDYPARNRPEIVPKSSKPMR